MDRFEAMSSKKTVWPELKHSKIAHQKRQSLRERGWAGLEEAANERSVLGQAPTTYCNQEKIDAGTTEKKRLQMMRGLSRRAEASRKLRLGHTTRQAI